MLKSLCDTGTMCTSHVVKSKEEAKSAILYVPMFQNVCVGIKRTEHVQINTACPNKASIQSIM